MNVKSYNYSDDYFAKLNDRWSQISYPTISDLVKKELENKELEVGLDFGCGNGFYGKLLNNYCKKLIGIDITESINLKPNRAYYSEIKVFDGNIMPFGNNEFDVLFSTEVIEHIKDYRKTFKEFYRVLKPGGLLLLTTTCYSTSIITFLKTKGLTRKEIIIGLIEYLKGYFSEEAQSLFINKWCYNTLGGHYHGFRTRQLKKDLNKIGFKIMTKKGLYILEPLQYHFKDLINFNTAKKNDYSFIKRISIHGFTGIVFILNPILKLFKLFYNNIYIAAEKI